ncbi:unnamed protein product [Dovyalis caffra]|uniref:Uncharacterized protein n=1 Tax=Dovyalis caffra TaxID=77055 RepID=A0AAV1SUK3_9ROSI|nr:unnamed protein product [Dovyalis caffra]
MHDGFEICLLTLETFRDLLSTDIDKQAERQGDIKVDAQDVSFEGSAKANSSLEIKKALDDTTARLYWGRANDPKNKILGGMVGLLTYLSLNE